MPEVPQEIVPEKKRPVVPPKMPEAPPVTGTCHLYLFYRRNTTSIFEKFESFAFP
jgi:hypothetical protein